MPAALWQEEVQALGGGQVPPLTGRVALTTLSLSFPIHTLKIDSSLRVVGRNRDTACQNFGTYKAFCKQ